MLVQLNISNFAIIKDLKIALKPGLNILSGETGAGKSIIINAMNLVLGGRASADLIRTGCKEARVEAFFSVPESPSLKGQLSRLDIPFEGDLLIKRTIFREGRNRIMVNGSMATLQMLSRLGVVLISISGQHEHQLLIRPENHLYLLDDFGGLSGDRLDLEKVFGEYQSLEEEIRNLERALKEAGERQELARFQIQEINTARLTPGEDQRLVEEKRRLQHAEELLEIASSGYQSIYERDDSLLSALAKCRRGLEKGAKADSRLAGLGETIAQVEATLEDVAFALRDVQKTTPLDPRRLEEVTDRLEGLNRLKRKYGPTLEEVLRFKETLVTTVDNMEEKREKLGQLRSDRRLLEEDLQNRSQGLSRERQKAAKDLERAVRKELGDLHMGATRFQVRFKKRCDLDKGEAGVPMEAITASGIDLVEFMISPNVGEDLRALSRIASGGELSRIMLAVKTILARTGSVETIIFDEVDSGISGATAEVVGEKLLSLSRYHQLLCITHLPQIASKGETHFLVRKEVIDGRTRTVIAELDTSSRIREIARLLGGKEITPSAVENAREMLAKV